MKGQELRERLDQMQEQRRAPQSIERDEALLPPVPATLRARQERRRVRAAQHAGGR